MFSEDAVRVSSTSSHLAGVPNRAVPAFLRAAWKWLETLGHLWSGLDGTPVSARVDTPPGNARADHEHICEAGVCFSVRSIDLEWKEVAGSYDSLCEQV